MNDFSVRIENWSPEERKQRTGIAASMMDKNGRLNGYPLRVVLLAQRLGVSVIQAEALDKVMGDCLHDAVEARFFGR